MIPGPRCINKLVHRQFFNDWTSFSSSSFNIFRLLHKSFRDDTRKQYPSKARMQYLSKEMADSTTADNNHLKSWGSSETVSLDDSLILCCVCKGSVVKVSDENSLQQTLDSIRRGNIGIFKSIVFMTCRSCDHVTHLHCGMNLVDSDIQGLVEYSESLPFRCICCDVNVQNEWRGINSFLWQSIDRF